MVKFTLYIIIVSAVKKIITRPAIQTRHKPGVEPLSTGTQIVRGAFIQKKAHLIAPSMARRMSVENTYQKECTLF